MEIRIVIKLQQPQILAKDIELAFVEVDIKS